MREETNAIVTAFFQDALKEYFNISVVTIIERPKNGAYWANPGTPEIIEKRIPNVNILTEAVLKEWSQRQGILFTLQVARRQRAYKGMLTTIGRKNTCTDWEFEKIFVKIKKRREQPRVM